MSLTNSKLDAVSYNSIWEEHCKKESRAISLVGSYAIPDPRKMEILPEKPNRTVPAQNPDPATIRAAGRLLQDLSCLKDTEKTPAGRFALPVTANMEYGFFATRPLVPQNPMFDYKTRTCDVTDFAGTFTQSLGHSPFTGPK